MSNAILVDSNLGRVLNCLPSPRQDEDWRFENALNGNLLSANQELPKTFDRRSAWWAVGDQGATGSCVGWAVADSCLRWHFVTRNRLRENERLSERYVWMAAKESDIWPTPPTSFIESAGTSIKAALDVARNFGCVRDALLPFEDALGFVGDEKDFYAAASQLKISAYVNITGIKDTRKDVWKRWLFANGPIITRLTVDATWRKVFRNVSDGKLDKYDSANAKGGHAIALVGYSEDAFIVRNSWGSNSGDLGFGYASWDYALDAFTEAYGVTA